MSETTKANRPFIYGPLRRIEFPEVTELARRILGFADSFELLTRHYGPGDHPSGTPQSVHGRGKNGSKAQTAQSSVDLDAFFPKVEAGELVDGRVVRAEIPNMESIAASLTYWQTLPEIREVRFSDFPLMTDEVEFYSKSEREKAERLAKLIDESGEINPLIVVVDDEGAYILEGAGRFDALRLLGAVSFPALVVFDMQSLEGEAD